jgi:hypothetical protein
MTTRTRSRPIFRQVRSASKPIVVLAWAMAVASLGFAVVNIVFEVTGRFDQGPLADYSSGISVVNWFVVVVKVLGAAVALLSVATRPRLAARTVNVLIWGAAGVLGIYSLGNLGQATGLAVGVGGSPDLITAAGVAYALMFLLAAAGFIVLATSHTRRSGLGPGPAILGSIGGLILLGTILVFLPMMLSALKIMPPH